MRTRSFTGMPANICRDAAPEARFAAGGLRQGGDGRHGIAVLSPALGDGGARGSALRSKVSTMIMRPPPQGHGGRWCGAAPAAGSASSCSAGEIDRGLGGGAADEPIFGCFAVMIDESDWTRAPVHAASPSLVGSGLRCRIIYTIGEWRTLRSIGK